MRNSQMLSVYTHTSSPALWSLLLAPCQISRREVKDLRYSGCDQYDIVTHANRLQNVRILIVNFRH